MKDSEDKHLIGSDNEVLKELRKITEKNFREVSNKRNQQGGINL